MRYSFVLIIALAVNGIAAEQQTGQGALALSLKRAVQLAISREGNEQIQITDEFLKQAQARSGQARAALLPDIASSLGYRSQTLNLRANGLRFNIPTIPGYSFEFPSLVGPFNVMDARISASQSVFDISSIRRLQSAHSGISAAESELESMEETVAAQVARAYLSAIRADADVETSHANVTLSQAVLQQAENQKGAGTGTGIEITRARVQLANDQQRLLVAENKRRTAHLQLLRVMNQPLNLELELTDKLGYVPADAVTLERAREQALAERPDLQAQQQRETSSRLAASATKMERIPSVSVFGDYGTIGSGFNNSLPTRVVGVAVRVPIFDGGRRDYRRTEAASQYRAEIVKTRALREQIELDVRLALDALHSAEEQVKVARDGLQLAENELAQARRRYDAGVSYSLEVTDAQTRLERARDNQTEALYNYNLARIDLEQAMGRVRSSVQQYYHSLWNAKRLRFEQCRSAGAFRASPQKWRVILMQKRIVALILVVLVLVAAILFFLNRNGRNPGNQIVVSGNIELTEVNIAFKTAGRLIERPVDEGDVVKKGQVIARLDQDQLLAQRDREEAGLQSARSMLAQAETALAWQRGNQAAELEQRRAELAAYQARLQELKSGSRPEEIQEARAAVDSAQAEYDRAKRDWERAQTLYKNDDISTAQYDQYRSRWENADAMLKQIKERRALVLAGPRKEQIEAAEAQVERARAALKMAESNALEIKRREQELPLRQAEIARAQANRALIGSQISDTMAISPVDGVVLVKAADVGEVLAAGTTVVTIGDIDHPWLRAYINETDLGRVKLGTRAKVKTDSYPGKEYEGRVSFIASEAEFTPKQIQTQEERVKLVYRIKIDLDNPNHELKSNMPADAVLILE